MLYWITVNYRESYGIYACNGILFNHESPRRGETFVTRKITRGLSRINEGIEECIYMGNLNALRDWWTCKRLCWDAVEDVTTTWTFWLCNSHRRQESVRKFIELAANALGWNKQKDGPGIIWEGNDLEEIGIRADNGKTVIRIDPRYFRPCEVETLLGDPSKASRELGWQASTKLEDLVKEMINEDLTLAKKEVLISQKGFSINYPKENPPNF